MASSNIIACCWSCLNSNPRCYFCRHPAGDNSFLQTPPNIRLPFQIPAIAAFNLKAIHDSDENSREAILDSLSMLRTRWPYRKDRTDGAAYWFKGTSTLLVQRESAIKTTPLILLEDVDGNVPTMDAMTWNEYSGAMGQGMLVCLSLKSMREKNMDNCACRKCLRVPCVNETFRRGMGMRSKEEMMGEGYTEQEWAFLLRKDGQSEEIIEHVPDTARIQEYAWW